MTDPPRVNDMAQDEDHRVRHLAAVIAQARLGQPYEARLATGRNASQSDLDIARRVIRTLDPEGKLRPHARGPGVRTVYLTPA